MLILLWWYNHNRARDVDYIVCMRLVCLVKFGMEALKYTYSREDERFGLSGPADLVASGRKPPTFCTLPPPRRGLRPPSVSARIGIPARCFSNRGLCFLRCRKKCREISGDYADIMLMVPNYAPQIMPKMLCRKFLKRRA